MIWFTYLILKFSLLDGFFRRFADDFLISLKFLVAIFNLFFMSAMLSHVTSIFVCIELISLSICVL